LSSIETNERITIITDETTREIAARTSGMEEIGSDHAVFVWKITIAT